MRWLGQPPTPGTTAAALWARPLKLLAPPARPASLNAAAPTS